MIHMTIDLSNTQIGADVTVGHGVIIHGARIGDGALIGMGSVLLDNSEVGEEAMLGAGSLLPLGMRVPPRTLALGSPAKVIRELTEEECRHGRQSAARYLALAAEHRQNA